MTTTPRRLLRAAAALALLAGLAPPAPADDVTRYLPEGAQFVVSVKVAELFASPAWKSIKDEGLELEGVIAEVEKSTGLARDQVERLVVTGTPGKKADLFFAIRSRKPLKAADVVAAQKERKY